MTTGAKSPLSLWRIMATNDQIELLAFYVQDTCYETFSRSFMEAQIDKYGSPERAAAYIWGLKCLEAEAAQLSLGAVS